MAKNISLLGANYPDVPAVQLPQTGGGTATFYDIQVIDDLNSTSTTDALIEKTLTVADGKITVELLSEDTDKEPGSYKWDLVEESGYRPIIPAWFMIGKVVGNKGAVMI